MDDAIGPMVGAEQIEQEMVRSLRVGSRMRMDRLRRAHGEYERNAQHTQRLGERNSVLPASASCCVVVRV